MNKKNSILQLETHGRLLAEANGRNSTHPPLFFKSVENWTTTDVAKLHKDIKVPIKAEKTLNSMQITYKKEQGTLQTKSKGLKELELTHELTQFRQQMKTKSKTIS